MKKNDLANLHQQSITELQAQVVKLEAELGKAQLQKSVGKLNNTRLMYTLRKDIAKIKTIIRSKELAAAATAASAKVPAEEPTTA